MSAKEDQPLSHARDRAGVVRCTATVRCTEAERDWVDNKTGGDRPSEEFAWCELQSSHTGDHHSSLLIVNNSNAPDGRQTEWWLIWSDDALRRGIHELSNCDLSLPLASSIDASAACFLFDGHPGHHRLMVVTAPDKDLWWRTTDSEDRR